MNTATLIAIIKSLSGSSGLGKIVFPCYYNSNGSLRIGTYADHLYSMYKSTSVSIMMQSGNDESVGDIIAAGCSNNTYTFYVLFDNETIANFFANDGDSYPIFDFSSESDDPPESDDPTV